jgi:hypothetical protein
VETPTATGYADCLSASWLAARLAVEPRRIDVMRRSGELMAVRPPGATEWLYPGWQLHDGRVRDVVPQLVAAARETGMDEQDLYRAMTGRHGLRGDGRLVDLLVGGDERQVLDVLRGRP